MPKKVSLKDILRLHPEIDPKKLRESLETQKRLRDRGFAEKGYELVPPFTGKRVQVLDTLPDIGDISHLNRE